MDVKTTSTRRKFLKWSGITALGAVGVGGAAGLYSWKGEPGWLEITAQSVRLPRLHPAFAGYRIVQLSDIHADESWMNKERLEAIVALTNEQQPDMVVITGDFVTKARPRALEALEALQELKARDGVFGVLGNHDYWSDSQVVRTTLEKVGVQELYDSAHTLTRGDAMLHLVGLDDLWPESDLLLPVSVHADRLQTILETVPQEGAIVLLVHEPDFADVAAATSRIGLQLSGHSHGGQVRIPLLGSPVVPPLGEKYVAGLYTVGPMLHYTHRGLGMVSPQVRFNCRPEIAVFTCTV